MSPRYSDRPTDAFVPISDYAVVGNDDRAALVGAHGSIDWCCFPHVESPSVFAAVLDPDEGGRFAIHPTTAFESTQRYVERTNVLETTFETDSGSATVTDVMPVRSEGSTDERHQQALYRKIGDVEGSIELAVDFEPRFDYARATTTLERDDRGDVLARTAPADDGDAKRLFLHADAPLEVGEDRASAALSLSAGDERWFALQYDRPNRLSADDREAVLSETVEYWRTWLEGCEEAAPALFEFEEEWRDVLTRSALALKLCIHEENGSIFAAPTTSLPEEIGGDLNWDYRFNWVRDAKFTIQALHNVGQTREAERYFEWFRDIGHVDPGDVQPLYGLHGETTLGEETLDHLSGYRNSSPVRIGNAAADQEQLDVYGTVVQGIYETIRYEDGLEDEDWAAIAGLADYVCDHWDERDAGIWEFRNCRRHFVHSKLLCWVALDRAIQLAAEYGREAPLDRWERERAAVRDAIETRGYSAERGAFVQHFDAEQALDATALLIPLYDFLPPEDERVQETIDTVLAELTTEGGLVRRFEGSDVRPREPGGFLLCSFWLIDALAVSGRLEEAEAFFDRLLEYTSPVGLFPEMIDTDDGTFLGNYPQAFSHIGLINSALYLASVDDGDAVPPEEVADGADGALFRRHDG